MLCARKKVRAEKKRDRWSVCSSSDEKRRRTVSGEEEEEEEKEGGADVTSSL